MTVLKWMKGFPDSFPVIYAEVWVWVWGGGGYWSVFFFLPFQEFTDISFPIPVAISDRHVTLRLFLNIFISEKHFPLIPVSIRSSKIN